MSDSRSIKQKTPTLEEMIEARAIIPKYKKRKESWSNLPELQRAQREIVTTTARLIQLQEEMTNNREYSLLEDPNDRVQPNEFLTFHRQGERSYIVRDGKRVEVQETFKLPKTPVDALDKFEFFQQMIAAKAYWDAYMDAYVDFFQNIKKLEEKTVTSSAINTATFDGTHFPSDAPLEYDAPLLPSSFPEPDPTTVSERGMFSRNSQQNTRVTSIDEEPGYPMPALGCKRKRDV